MTSMEAGPNLELAELVERLSARLEAGALVDWEELDREYPDHATELRRLLPTLQRLAELSRGPSVIVPDGESHLPGELGDYRIIREIGRGGMGIVYEAEQMSLRRRVALKVLPFASLLDSQHLQRFKNEALAAASLDHPHVVKVYAVGCERGVHFIAMQYIDGRTLADLIRERRDGPKAAHVGGQEATCTFVGEPTETGSTRSPASRSNPHTPLDYDYIERVTQWGIDAAEALEHAHSLGIVHRDIKPGNLLVDGQGEIYIADFGLAKVANAPGVTTAGDLLGTVRYMSPEQAEAQHDLVDHRADIYSLGATLYEVLTLTPVFDGLDRHAILSRIATVDPTAPRKVDRRIPRDLETVIVKTLEKDSSQRYQSAIELAGDLKRFLIHEPIRAKPPAFVPRVAKWARRNRAAVWSAAAAFMVGVAALTLTTVLVVRAYESEAELRKIAERDAELERAGRVSDAVEVLVSQCEDALRSDDVLRAEVALAAAEERSAEGDSDQIQRRLQRCRASVLLLRDITDHLYLLGYANTGGHLEAKQAIEAAVEKFGIRPGETSPAEAARLVNDSPVEDRVLMALDLWLFASRSAELRSILRAIDPDPFRDRVRDSLVTQDIDRLRELADQPEATKQPARFLAALGSISAIPTAIRAKLLSAGVSRWPSDFRLLFSLGNCSSTPEEREKWYRAAVALRPLFPGARLSLATAIKDRGELEEAIDSYQQAIQLDPGNPDPYFRLGMAFSDHGQFRAALESFRTAEALEWKRREDFWREKRLIMSRSWGGEPLSRWVSRAERLVKLDDMLPGILAGRLQPSDQTERLGLAEIAQVRRHYATSARLYAGALLIDTKLADQLDGPRYAAACAAVQAGTGRGEDASNLTENDTRKWRQSALNWLTSELHSWEQWLKSNPYVAGQVRSTLRHWYSDPKLAPVRDPVELVKLPEAEQIAWGMLWADVARLLNRLAPPAIGPLNAVDESE
jgi:serine/threonine protein kinase